MYGFHIVGYVSWAVVDDEPELNLHCDNTFVEQSQASIPSALIKWLLVNISVFQSLVKVS